MKCTYQKKKRGGFSSKDEEINKQEYDILNIKCESKYTH